MLEKAAMLLLAVEPLAGEPLSNLLPITSSPLNVRTRNKMQPNLEFATVRKT